MKVPLSSRTFHGRRKTKIKFSWCRWRRFQWSVASGDELFVRKDILSEESKLLERLSRTTIDIVNPNLYSKDDFRCFRLPKCQSPIIVLSLVLSSHGSIEIYKNAQSTKSSFTLSPNHGCFCSLCTSAPYPKKTWSFEGKQAIVFAGYSK